MITLDAYIDAVLAEPWVWGKSDCCFFGGDWILAATGRDPLGPYRGIYDSALAAARFVAQGSGLVATVGAEMARCGFARTDAPEHGDIAVIDMVADSEHTAARASVVIRSGPWWIGRALDGVVGFEGQPEAMWRVL